MGVGAALHQLFRAALRLSEKRLQLKHPFRRKRHAVHHRLRTEEAIQHTGDDRPRLRGVLPEPPDGTAALPFDEGQRQRRHRQRNAVAVDPLGDPAVAFVEEVERVFTGRAAPRRVDLRQKILQKPVVVEGEQMLVPVARTQDLLQLQRKTRRRGVADQRQHGEERVFRRRVEGEVVLPDQLERAEHPHRILLEAEARVADRPHHAGTDVVDPLSGEVDEFRPDRIVKEGVDREVAPPGILFGGSEGVVGENHVLRQLLVLPPVRPHRRVFRGGSLPEGAHFKEFAAVADMHQPEPFADDPGRPAAEDVAHLLRRRRGGDVVVLGAAAEQQVADRPADDIGFESGILQRGNEFDDAIFDRKFVFHRRHVTAPSG